MATRAVTRKEERRGWGPGPWVQAGLRRLSPALTRHCLFASLCTPYASCFCQLLCDAAAERL